jgi:drug/metabolite transporter (DMT)-like permease
MGSFAMVLASFFWASMAVGNKAVLDTMLVTEVALIRFVGAGLLLWCIQLVRREGRGPLEVGRWPFVMGLLEPGLVTLFTIWGTAHTSAINAAMVWAVLPMTQPLLGRLVLKEPIHAPVILGATLTFGGTALLFWGQGQEGQGSWFGDLLLAIGVACSAGNQLLGRRVALARGRPLAVTTAQFMASTLVGLVALFLIQRPAAPFADVTPDAAAILCWLVLATAAPFSLYNFALARLPIGRISLFSPLIGPMGALLAVVLLGETLTVRDAIAIAIVMLGSAVPSIARALGRR